MEEMAAEMVEHGVSHEPQFEVDPVEERKR